MAYFVEILTPNSAWSCVMRFTFPIEGMRSIISMVSISLEGFVPSILLLVVIIVAVVIVVVILVVVAIDAIVGVVIVVASIEICALVSGPLICEICWWLPPDTFGYKTTNLWNLLTQVDPISLFYSDRLSVCIPPRQGIISQVFLLGLSTFAMAAAYASRAATTPSVISCRMVASVIAGLQMVQRKEFKTSRDRHGNNGMSDPTRVLVSLGKKTSMSKRYLVKLFEESGETLLGEAEKQFRMLVEKKVFLISESDGTIVE
nr:hypothetical protein [Tanacetum cinerariifolium]